MKVAHNPKSRFDGYCGTPKSKLVHLDALFRNLAEGKTPNFIAMMQAISEIGVFNTKYDTIDRGAACRLNTMSQKKCRFCD